MKPVTLILRTILAWFALLLAQFVANLIVPITFPGAERVFPWILLTYFLTVVILAYIALHADLRGWKLGFALAVIPAAIALTNYIEGVVFLKTTLPWFRVAVQTLLTYLLVAPVWGVLFGRRPAGDSHVHPLAGKSSAEKIWRFLVSDVSYIVLYLTAGTIIFPYVRDFYATQTLPSMPTIIALQLLVRGPIFVVLSLWIVRLLGLPRLSGAVATGLCFTILSGFLPLLIPNPIFPDAVRWVHMAEVTSSNFVFAFFVAWLWTSSPVHAVALPRAA
jgi:hypothetical protein